MSKEKIVLSNSVGKDDLGYYIIHSPSRWSEGVKLLSSWFSYYPWELAYASSLLKERTDLEVKLLDPCLQRWDKSRTLEEILQQEPSWVIMEVSTRVIEEDLWVLKNLKQRRKSKVVCVGQHASAFPQELLNNGIDYVCLGEYEDTLVELLQGQDPNYIQGLYPNQPRAPLEFSQLPWPEDQDVKRIDYAKPGEPSSEYIEIQAYASRGCLGRCSFCVASNVYYSWPNWRKREIADLIDEIKYLKEKYPQMEGVFFDEEVHNKERNYLKALTEAFIREKLSNLKFEAMCDIRFMDEEMLDWLKSAGYYKIRFGIETAAEELAHKIGKSLNIARITSLLRYAQRIKLKTYAAFVFGLPYSNFKIDLQTLNFIEEMIKEGLLTNVQISTAIPLPGTPFYSWAKEKGYLLSDDPHLFDGGNAVIVDYPWYRKEEIEKIREMALLKRDHISFKINLRKEPLKFIYSRYRKYGLRLLGQKMRRRLKTEINYLKEKQTALSEPK